MIKRLGLFTVILVLMFSAIPFSLADSDCDFSYSNHARGAQLYSMGDLTRALHHYDCALAQNPDSDILRLSIGNIYRDMGDDVTAQAYYDHVSTAILDPVVDGFVCEQDISHHVRGPEVYAAGDIWMALYHFECALVEDPNNNSLLQSIGNIYSQMGDVRTAVAYFNRMSELDAPATTVASTCETGFSHYARGAQMYSMGDLNRALHHYDCALKNDPESDVLLLIIGNIYRDIGDDATAQTYYNRSALYVNTTETTCVSASSDLAEGSAMHDLGDLERATVYYHCALIQEPTRIAVMVQLAQAYVEMSDYDNALFYLNRAIQLDDDNAALYNQRGYTHFMSGHLQEALLDLNVALDLNPDLTSAQRTRALVLAQLAQVETLSVESPVSKHALPQLDDALNTDANPMMVAEVAPNSSMADTVRKAADDLFEAYEFAAAIVQYEALLAFEPENAYAHYRIGYAYYALENPAQGLSYLQQSDKLNPSILYTQYLLAMTYSMLDMSWDAFDTMTQIHQNYAYDGAFEIALGHVYRNLGYYESSGTEFNNWIEQHELVRMDTLPVADQNSRTLVMDYGVVYEMPFHAVAGDNINITAESSVMNRLPVDPLIVVLDADGVPIAGDDDSGDLFDAQLSFIIPSTERYTLVISHAGGNSSGDVNVTITGIFDGGSYDDYMMRAKAYLALDDYINALSEYQLALDIAPDQSVVYAAMGRVYRIMEDWDAAAATYSQALDINPMLDHVRCELGMIYAMWGDYDGAIREFDTVLGHNQTDSCAWSNRRATIRLANNPNMLTELAAPAQPSPADDLVATGYQLLQESKEFSAAHAFRDALRIDPSLDTVRCDLIGIYLDWGNYLGASNELYRIQSHSCADEQRAVMAAKLDRMYVPMTKASTVSAAPAQPSPADDLVAQGYQYLAENKKVSAAQSFFKALRVDPSLDTVRCELIGIQLDWGNYLGAQIHLRLVEPNPCAIEHRAVMAAKLARTFIPLTAEDFVYHADAHRLNEEWQAAIDDYLQALTLDPLRSDVRCTVGMVYVELDDYEAALYQFDIILSQHATDSCAWSNRNGLMQRLREMPIESSTYNVDVQEAYSDGFLAQDVYDYPMPHGTVADVDLDAVYEATTSKSEMALLSEAQLRYDMGDTWTASALLDRYIDEHYTTVCAGELRELSRIYRELGYTVMANMVYLQAISDSTC